jgi:predicted phage-related endonuclease
MTLAPEIKARRSRGIGGSEVSAILGLNKYSSPYKVWLVKTGREAPFSGNKYTDAGTLLESAVVDFFHKETHYRIIKSSAKQKVYVHPKYNFAIGMPDRFYFGNKVGKGILECKTTQASFDEPDETWFAQLQWYLGVVGLMYGGVAWLEHGLNFKYQEYEFDPDFFNFMITEVKKFWEENILKDIPPDPINVEDVQRMFTRHIEGSKLEASPEMIAVHAEIRTVRDAIKELEAKEKDLADRIKFVMRDTEVVISGTKPLFTWKTTEPIHRLDQKGLKEAEPDIYNKWIKEEPGIRKFLVK